MFLFTSITGNDKPESVSGYLETAARRTGVDFDYLLDTAKRESAMNPDAKARTSSAAGLFQFVESTWLSAIDRWGAKYGLGEYADQIDAVSSGKRVVSDAATRAEILDLRFDPKVSALMAGEFTRDNARILSEGIGRDPNAGELYIAHFLGAGGAVDMINLAAENPDASAADYFPAAARANHSIFYDRKGNAKSAADVYAGLIAKHGGGSAEKAVAEAVDARNTGVAAFLPQQRRDSDLVFSSLFTGGGSAQAVAKSGPLGEAVQTMWLNFFGKTEALAENEPARITPEAVDKAVAPAAKTRRAAHAPVEEAPRIRNERLSDPSLLVR